MHLSNFDVPIGIAWAGQTLQTLNLGHRFGVHVASVLRGNQRINIPSAQTVILPGDRLQVIGSDQQLDTFRQALNAEAQRVADAPSPSDKDEMKLKCLVVGNQAPIVGRSIKDSGIREQFHCLIVGVESGQQEELRSPSPNQVLQAADVLWIVGEEADLKRLQPYVCQ